MKMYQYPGCSTCRKAKAWLSDRGVLEEIEQVHIVESPPSREELEQLTARSGLDLKRFFNTSGKSYRDLSLKDAYATLTDSERLDLLAADGKLIKRPLLVLERGVLVGFKEAEYEAMFKERAPS